MGDPATTTFWEVVGKFFTIVLFPLLAWWIKGRIEEWYRAGAKQIKFSGKWSDDKYVYQLNGTLHVSVSGNVEGEILSTLLERPEKESSVGQTSTETIKGIMVGRHLHFITMNVQEDSSLFTPSSYSINLSRDRKTVEGTTLDVSKSSSVRGALGRLKAEASVLCVDK